MPKVSIVMPMLNSIKYLEECMDNVVKQTLRDIEIIVVDAGSTDGTLERIKQYMENDNRIRLIISEEKSMGKQYNMGIAAATGEYIGFCESDDCMPLNAIEILYNVARKNDIDYAKGDCSHFYSKNGNRYLFAVKSGLRDWYDTIIVPKQHPDLIMADSYMWNGIYRKDFLINNNIILNETSGAAYQDAGFIQQVHIKAEKAIYISENVYFYRKDNPGASVRNPKTMKFVLNEYKFIMNIIRREKTKYEEIIQYMLCKYFYLLGAECRKHAICADIKTMNDLREIIIEDYNKLSRLQKMEIMGRDSLGWYYFFEDIEKYKEYCIASVDAKKQLFDSMCNEIKKHEEVVIWGCGEQGQVISYMLKGVGIENIVAVTDNSPDKWGKKMCNINVVPPKIVFEQYKDAFYVVTPINYRFDIVNQLLAEGVCKERIYMSIGIGRGDVISCLYDRL